MTAQAARGTAIVAVLFACSAAAGGQQTPPTPGDRTIAAGGGRISGVVVTDEAQPAPVRRAIVTIGGGDFQRQRSAITNDEGHFVIDGLPVGRFTVTASRKPFLTMAYGAKRPGRPGTPIGIGRDQDITGITIRIPRGAVLTGVIVDQAGEPVAGAGVSVLRAVAGLPVEGAAITDDLGTYRVYGLMPGGYLVAATPRAGLGDMEVMSEAEIDRAFRELQTRSAHGASAPGAGTPLAGNARSDVSAVKASSRPVSYAPVFYPGSPLVSEALTITLAAGEERSGLDIPIVPVPTAAIEGVVFGSSGQPLSGAQLSLAPVGTPFRLPLDLAMGSSSDAEGKFRYKGVTPGQYRLTATTGAPFGLSSRFGPARSFEMAGGLGNLWAAADVIVNGEDIAGVMMTLGPGLKLSGRVVFDATSESRPKDLTSARVRLTPIPEVAGVVAAVATAKADGSFEFSRLLPGQYQLTASAPGGGPQGWWLRSAHMGGRDVLDNPLEIGSDNALGECVVTFTDRHSELSGVVQFPDGSTASDYSVVVFAADRAYWRPQSRRVRLTRVATDGHYLLRDLPAGEYLIAAPVDLEPDDLDTPAFLDRLASGAERISLVDGERKVVNVDVVRQ